MWETYVGHLSFSLWSIWIKNFVEKNGLDLDEAHMKGNLELGEDV
jgi:hypothetical protein